MKNYKDFQKYFKEDILSIKGINHKGNNQLFKIVTKPKKFILKKYSTIQMDNWKRGETEFKALDYLWNKGFREIPQPFNFFKEDNTAIYSFELGETLNSSNVSRKQIKQLSDFLVKLHNLEEKHRIQFGPACSACLNLQEYNNVLDKRVANLFNYKIKDPVSEKAQSFFETEILPIIGKLKTNFYKKTKGIDLEKELGLENQVITPADFGFHNVLFDNGRTKFLDFEYFGRDDPVRQILDFMHHIKSNEINSKLKNYFLKCYLNENNPPGFLQRLKLVDPLIAMTWVLIPMNVFSKQRMERLDTNNQKTKKMLEERLNSAKTKLKTIK